MNRKLHLLVHGVLFGFFFLAAVVSVIIWFSTFSVAAAGISATIAAFFATASAFIDRMFPGQG